HVYSNLSFRTCQMISNLSFTAVPPYIPSPKGRGFTAVLIKNKKQKISKAPRYMSDIYKRLL
ncbi:MAG: hypothetical protein LBD24_03560, partial [Spirochaetaceae bacterium]|nr:hypothetical protein [Spirochaetaceae bacterium]